MIVDDLRVTDLGDRAERSARVRWAGGEMRVSVMVPAELAGDPEDASPFLPGCLLPAMRRREELRVDASASPRMLAGARRAEEIYRSWCPDLPETPIAVAGEREPVGDGEGVGCFYSRGVDSTYSAAVERPDPITCLVFGDGLEPLHDERVRAREIQL